MLQDQQTDSTVVEAEPVNANERVATNAFGLPIEPETGRFVSGHKGGPGRPKGSRNKLGEAFVADLYQDWQEHGLQVLAAARESKPADYLKVIASLLPRDIRHTFNELSDGELSQRIEQLAESLGIQLIEAKPNEPDL